MKITLLAKISNLPESSFIFRRTVTALQTISKRHTPQRSEPTREPKIRNKFVQLYASFYYYYLHKSSKWFVVSEYWPLSQKRISKLQIIFGIEEEYLYQIHIWKSKTIACFKTWVWPICCYQKSIFWFYVYVESISGIPKTCFWDLTIDFGSICGYQKSMFWFKIESEPICGHHK